MAINFEARTEPGVRVLYMGLFSKPYPDSHGVALHAGEQYCIKQHGQMVWKPVQWFGLNLTQDDTRPTAEPVVINKNDLMKEIVERQNRRLLKQYVPIFTDAELKMLREKMRAMRKKS